MSERSQDESSAVDKEGAPSVHELQERLRRSELKLRGIEAISKSLMSEHHLERILEAVMERTTELLDAERATLYLIEEGTDRMWSKVTLGDNVERIELRLGQGLAGWVGLHGRPVNVKDAYRDRRFDPSMDQVTKYRTTSVLCRPLRNSRQHIMGVIQVLNKRGGYFTPADEELLAAISSQAAITIQNSKLYLEVVGKNIALLETQLRLKERTSELELLFRIERAAATATTQDAALRGTLEATLEEFPSEAAAVALVDPYTQEVRYEVVMGPDRDRIEGQEALSVASVLAEGEPVIFAGGNGDDDSVSELREAHPDWSIRTMVCVPLIHREERLGVLQLINRSDDPRGYDRGGVRMLEMIGRRMAMAVMLARSLEEDQKAERLAAIGQTLSGVVHDLKTPLTIINGYAQLMVKEEEAESRSEFKRLIGKQIAQLKSMTAELLAFARGESRAFLRKIYVNAFVGEVAELLRTEFAGSGVELVVDTPYRGAVRIDESKMKRLVFNLARNAREAMPKGGTFRIAVEEIDSRVVFTFSDDGPGIPDEMQGRLFESFATYGKKNGTGLGLAVAKKIADEHGATISVSSERGQGTTFTLTLPPPPPPIQLVADA